VNDAHIATLLAERATYVKAKKPKRVAEVERELARYGVDPSAPTKKGAA